MKKIINHIKELQKEYYHSSTAYAVLRRLEVELPGLFPPSEQKTKEGGDFEKFSLLRDTPTIATDNDIFEGIETMMFSAFLQGKEDKQFKDWYVRNQMKEMFKSTLDSYAAAKRQQVREETIQECVDAIIRLAGIKYYLNEDAKLVLGEATIKIEQLKSK